MAKFKCVRHRHVAEFERAVTELLNNGYQLTDSGECVVEGEALMWAHMQKDETITIPCWG